MKQHVSPYCNNISTRYGLTDTQTHWTKLLHQAGCRVTVSREAVISVMFRSLRPLGVQELHELAREQHPDLGLVTVNRTLEKLLELNLAQRIHRADEHRAYLPVSNSDQHMLLCNSRGQITFFDGDISALAEVISRKTSYKLDLSLIQFLGLCADCQH